MDLGSRGSTTVCADMWHGSRGIDMCIDVMDLGPAVDNCAYRHVYGHVYGHVCRPVYRHVQRHVHRDV